MRWIREHKRASIFIATAIVLLIIFVVSAVLGKTGVGPGKLFMSASEKIQKPASSAGRSVSDSARGIFKYRWVVKENNELKEEIRILKNDFVKEKLKKKELEELRELSKALNYKEITKNYKHVSANIVAMNGFSWLNIFTIDRGSKDGIKIDSIVVSGDGLVGRVSDVSGSTAKIISIVDESNNVSFRIIRNMTYLGVLQGDGKGGLTGFMLDDKAQVIEGDELITSGMGIYPEGINIGKIESVKMDRNTLLKTVKIAPSVTFKNLSKVMVLT